MNPGRLFAILVGRGITAHLPDLAGVSSDARRAAAEWASPPKPWARAPQWLLSLKSMGRLDGVRGVCFECACTQERACAGGCAWANLEQTLCTACVAPTWLSAAERAFVDRVHVLCTEHGVVLTSVTRRDARLVLEGAAWQRVAANETRTVRKRLAIAVPTPNGYAETDSGSKYTPADVVGLFLERPRRSSRKGRKAAV